MVVVLAAMQQELDGIVQAQEHGWRPALQTRVTGVGKVMAAMTTQRIIDELAPQAVLMVGVAGGLNPRLSIGDVVVGAETLQHDLDVTALGIPRGTVPFTGYRWLAGDEQLLQAAKHTILPGKNEAGQPVQLHAGRILTGDQFMSRAAQQQHRYLVDELNGDAVDMESAAVAQVCVCNNIPHLVLRVISDTADGSARVDFWRFLPRAGQRIQQLTAAVLDAAGNRFMADR
ncbi:5'-methylthioadenosine/adenosylhomocysteine nucleosidase [Spirochaeta africana]|uniref:adenosylhomocysteine nucleosidase n=1 Tax=Spirochaeta africana (strain ATCC 700263 / DSM 8902 / Z-7692) TaxID=889378 RepID=H9UM48_SPIAZ|nr:5'-methylthioadenosine/adenosylhomocysteine nucleosidase [Spirochaeta africana]AFG38591.1 5'-methylthioadenosine/S-adenosylhomocysteine nucleosidase [Spirochaeta africana DSM 8902]